MAALKRRTEAYVETLIHKIISVVPPDQLFDKNGWCQLILILAEYGHLAGIKLLAQAGAQQFQDYLGAAATSGHWPVINYLLDQGQNFTPLSWADAMSRGAAGGHLDVVQFFYAKGVDEVRETLNESLEWGLRKNNYQIIEWCVAELQRQRLVQPDEPYDWDCHLQMVAAGGIRSGFDFFRGLDSLILIR